MASSTSPIQIEDQTDEDFFDKLVDDEFDGSQSKPEEITRVLSNISLGDSLDDSIVPEFAYKVETVEKVDVLNPTGIKKEIFFVSGGGLPLETSGSCDSDKIDIGKRDGSKGTNVKVVQWSAFTVDSSQAFEKVDGFEPYSDFLTENSDGFFSKPVENFSSNADFTEQHDTQFSGLANEQTVDENDPKYWESLYPGWKFDASAGQWYQVGGYDATKDAQLDNSSVAGIDSVSESLGECYLQQASQPALETIAEDCAVNSVSNCYTQVGMEYPSNMVFDPQYPGWYYDTNTQQWYTLESYTQELANNSTSNAVQDHLPKDTNLSTDLSWEHDHNLYSNIGLSEQHGTQREGSQEFGHVWNASIDNYAPQTSLYGNIDQSAQQANQSQASQDFGWSPNASTSNHDQKNIIYSSSTESEQTVSQGWGSQDFGQNWSTAMSNHSPSNSLYSNISPTARHGDRVQGSWDFGQSWQASMSDRAQQNKLDNNISQSEQHVNQGEVSQGFRGHSDASKSTYALQNMWQPHPLDSNEHTTGFSGDQQTRSFYGTIPGGQTTKQTGFKAFEPVVKQNYGSSNNRGEFQSFASTESTHQFYQPMGEQNLQAHFSNSHYGDQNFVTYSQQSFLGPNTSQFSYAPNEGRSSAGRPPHALVAFGFGGKLIVMKNVNSFGTTLDYGNQENPSGAISVLSLSDVVKDKEDASGVITGRSHSYFHALCQPYFPGPLVGGSAAAKDVNKWMDEKIAHCESTSMDAQKGEFLKLLLSLLKIMCQHYGKLRSPFGVDPSLEEIDGPESAVTKLFASARNNSARLTELGSLTRCLQNLPSEGQIRATAIEVQNLLVSGRRKEALQYAQEGQLWGPALVLAAQLGEKFYVETVKKMAQHQFVSGSPLRTLCLLIAGQHADVFAADSSPKFSAANGLQGPTQVLANGMLDDWEKNLAIITANRTKDDELVMIHLGDCLLKERGEIIAAHTCYLVAEANFESYSDSARLCLIGADHWKSPRTYASPEAIQRTEVYEYSKVLGNSQFILLPFQPYKLIYAYMLAEVGKVSDSLRYCQASLKLLKNSSRAPEVEMWKTLFSSFEERLRTHQQGGYSSNLAPAKLVGKLFTSIDRSLHRMIGAPPPALPPMPPSSANCKESFSMVPKVAASQSTMAMSSLMPSASVEAISEWSGDGGRKAMHNRSISEPDFGRSPKDAGSTDGQSKSSGAPSRFGRIGSQLLQKTMGWVSRSRPDRQAKLGESNKFYYDEKLKRWVEEGAVPPAEEAALPPPPTAVAFQNGATDHNINSAFENQSPTSNGRMETKSPVPLEPNSRIPPVPPGQNQFSARGRMGVRSRYVDTFNKGASGTGGMLTTSFQSPPASSSKPAIGAKFFVPTTPAPSDATEETIQEPTTSTFLAKETHFSLPSTSPSPPSSSLQRISSMDNISPSSNNANGLLSRARASSWSGTYSKASSHKIAELGGGSPPQFLPQNQPSASSGGSLSLQLNGCPIGDDLHEVEL